jgi:hypothetical protein
VGVDQSVTVLVASAISAVVALTVVALQSDFERRRQAYAARIERLANFFAAAHAVAIGIGSLARTEIGDKDATELRIREELADRFNTRFAQIRLLEDQELVDVATRLDRELVAQTELARSKQWSRADWRMTRMHLRRAD